MKILVVSAHPDDETLGCGGTLLKHAANGDTLFWLIATCAYPPQWSEAVIQQKALEVEQVAAAYQMQKVFRLNLPTARLDTLPIVELVAKVREVIEATKPNRVYLMNRSDIHTDHQILFNAMMIALKPFKGAVSTVLCYECLSSTDAAPVLPERVFLPTVFSDITRYLERKLEIMRLYQTEMQPYPLPRAVESIEALARLRGTMIGVVYAETFMLMREIF